MKKLVAFVLILTLGLFTAVGCSKPADKKKGDEKAKAGAADVAKPAADAAKPAPEEKK